MARSSRVRRGGGVRPHRRCGAFAVFCAFCAAALCVVAFTPGGVVKVVVAAETSDTTNVSGEKKTSESSFAFATPASKGLSANSLEVRGR